MVENSIYGCIPDNDYILLTPGPLTTSKRVKSAMLKDLCTWDADFNDMVQLIRRELVGIAAHDKDKYTCILLQGSGTFAVEAVLTTAVPDSGKLLVLANGAYGKRIADIASCIGIDYLLSSQSETLPLDPVALKFALERHPEITHVAFVHCETTTGLLNPLAELSGIVKDAGKTLVVDAMSSFAGIPMDIGRLGIDYLISSSNKCIQGVPGAAFVICRRDEIKRCSGNSRSLALDLYSQWNTMEEMPGKWRFTAPTHVIRALMEAILELEEEGGVAARHSRYIDNQECLVDGMEHLGFYTVLDRKHQSPVITSFFYPERETFDFRKLYGILKENGFIIYPGKLTELDTFRIGSIGHIDRADVLRLLEVIAGNIFW